MQSKHENLAYILLEDPKFLYSYYRIRSLTRFRLPDAEIKAIMDLMSNKEFQRKARRYYEERLGRGPSEAAQRALREIEMLEAGVGEYKRVSYNDSRRQDMTKKAPQLYISHGRIPLNGDETGLALFFDQAGDGWARWRQGLGPKTVYASVTDIERWTREQLWRYLAGTEIVITRVAPDHDLPFAGALDGQMGRVWWMATLPDGPVTAELRYMRGFTTRTLEDRFNNSSARITTEALYYGSLPETQPMPRELPKFKGYTVDSRLREFRKMEYGKKCEFVPFDSAKGTQLLEEMGWAHRGEWGWKAPQTEQSCPVCGGPLVPMGKLGKKEWYRCRNCGMEVSSDTPKSVPQIPPLYATPERKFLDELERLWKNDPKEFYRRLKEVKDAIKEREGGKIKKLPALSLTQLRWIKAEADKLYR